MLESARAYNRAMATAKQAVSQFLDRLPDDTSLEEIQYQIYVRLKVEAGLADVASGKVQSAAEIERRMQKWLGK
jgi:predicted transcriptional regulator